MRIQWTCWANFSELNCSDLWHNMTQHITTRWIILSYWLTTNAPSSPSAPCISPPLPAASFVLPLDPLDPLVSFVLPLPPFVLLPLPPFFKDEASPAGQMRCSRCSGSELVTWTFLGRKHQKFIEIKWN